MKSLFPVFATFAALLLAPSAVAYAQDSSEDYARSHSPRKDADGDGVRNDADACPDLAQGPGGSYGCPVPFAAAPAAAPALEGPRDPLCTTIDAYIAGLTDEFQALKVPEESTTTAGGMFAVTIEPSKWKVTTPLEGADECAIEYGQHGLYVWCTWELRHPPDAPAAHASLVSKIEACLPGSQEEILAANRTNNVFRTSVNSTNGASFGIVLLPDSIPEFYNLTLAVHRP